MACWGSDALRGCSKLPHQGCLEVPKREDREHAQPLTWVKVFQAWRGSFFRKPVCSMLQYGNRADRDAKSNVEPAGPLASTMSLSRLQHPEVWDHCRSHQVPSVC